MAYDGNGNFVRLHNWTADAANGVDINANEMDGEDNGFAAGLSNAVTRDGQGKMSADFLPGTDNTFALGSGARRWLSINGIPVANFITSITQTQAALGAIINAQTLIELAKGITPSNTLYPPGYFYRYGAKGGAGRTADAVIASTVLTSASGGFANAVAGMVCVVVDGGAPRAGGRPAPLITTILSVQSANQITLATPVIAPASVTMTGTLNSNTSITSTSVSPITAGVGLTRTWAITGTNIPASTTVSATSASTLTISQAATGSGAQTLTLTAPIEVCFGYDDSAGINAALSLPYPIVDIKDNFLTTQPMVVGGAGCNNVSMPSTLLIFAINNNASHCVTAAGLDRTNGVRYLTGIRYLPFEIDIGEMDCCNSGLDGIQLQQSNNSRVRARITNSFRNALGEFFLVDGHWQEGNVVDINCGRVGLHFHHKVTKSASYQTLGGYRIHGRSPGLNSVYLGINATTQKDQLGGGIRLYTGGSSVADGGMSQNTWGMGASCELDGQRIIALSFGSDIGNSAVTFVDASATYVIEGAPAAAFSNVYRSNMFGAIVIEDISQSSDVRGGFQYYAMPNVTLNDTTVISSAGGPWGQTAYNAAVWNVANTDNFFRNTNNIAFTGSLTVVGSVGTNGQSPATIQTGWGTPTAGAVVANYNGASATLVQTSNALSSVLTQLQLLGLLKA